MNKIVRKSLESYGLCHVDTVVQVYFSVILMDSARHYIVVLTTEWGYGYQ